MELRGKIRQLANDYFDDVLSWRRYLHAHPELAFEEKNTADFIAKKLTEIGISFERGIAKTGIVAILQGKNPNKKTIALRADMDALPIHEENEVDYKSKNVGVMHACGHDVHTVSLLGAARILFALKDEWEGTVKLIFQPSEEKLPGGASVMIKEGVLQSPDVESIWGQHVHPPLQAGQIGIKSGSYMASADEIYITVKGKGGHAALPQNNIDPILISAHLITALQQLVSRRANPSVPTVLSFGKITGDGATNIIPGEVKLEGTFRTFDEKWRFKAHDLIKELATGLCKSMGGDCDVEVRIGYPSVYNDPGLSMQTKSWAIDYLGKENVIDLPIRMTGEDFAFYAQKIPGCFYRLGTGNPGKGIVSPIHSSTFDIDENALKTGMGLMAWIAVRGLQV
jgi:amidohydrolase